jgi:hypothetical protein
MYPETCLVYDHLGSCRSRLAPQILERPRIYSYLPRGFLGAWVGPKYFSPPVQFTPYGFLIPFESEQRYTSNSCWHRVFRTRCSLPSSARFPRLERSPSLRVLIGYMTLLTATRMETRAVPHILLGVASTPLTPATAPLHADKTTAIITTAFHHASLLEAIDFHTAVNSPPVTLRPKNP